MSDYFGPIAALMMFVAVVTSLITIGLVENEYHVEAVARGYAHYDLNSAWHWNSNAPR